MCCKNFHTVFILWLSVLTTALVFFSGHGVSTLYSFVVDCAPDIFLSTLVFPNSYIRASGSMNIT
jgi:hypothetical protein